MSAPARLAAFAVAVALAFGAGFGAGEIVGPLDENDTDTPAPTEDVHDDHGS